MKIIKRILLLLLVVFVIAQFFQPEKNEGDLTTIEPFLSETNPPENVQMILKTACFDCHSNNTRYPWYSKITPVNFWLADHIRHGKGELNFSKWNDYSANKKDHKLEEVIELVENKEMPLESYTWAHKDAVLTDAQIDQVVQWAELARIQYALKKKPQ